MTCPECSGKVCVVDLVNADDNTTYRKRKCKSCGHIFYTVEFEVVSYESIKDEWNRCYRKTKERNKQNEI